MTDASVIIVNYNTCALLQACLASVREDTSATKEIIVIDNASADGSVAMVREKFPEVRLIVNTANQGFAAPNNAGMRLAKGRCVFLLNSDTVLHRGTLGTLVAVLDRHPEAWGCGPKLVYPDGRLQPSAKGFPSLWTHACDMLLLDQLLPQSRLFGRGEMRWFDYREEGTVDHLMAAALMVRIDALRTVGLLDERFSIYYNDMDWCWRMARAGYTLVYTPAAVVEHHLGATIGTVNKRFAKFQELYENTMLFYQKRYGRWAVVVYRLLLAVGFVPRSLAWFVISLVHGNEHSRMMREFSVRSLALGLQWWRPLPMTTVEPPSL